MEKQLISVKDFSPEELRKWQLKLLDILVYFRDFCESNNLKFFLAGGTLIGAIRHKGFIPWDDDVDVQMLREDYDKLLKIWNLKADTSKYVCEFTTKNKCARFPMAVIRSTDTTCIYDHSVNDDICQGLKIDVEFLDVVPKGFLRRKICSVYALVLALFRTQRLPKRVPLIKKLGSRLLFAIIPTRSLQWSISNWCEKQIKKYNPGTDNDDVRYFAEKESPKAIYSEVKWVDFENSKMPIPIGWDRYLKDTYGNYMQLPPESQRKPATDNLVFYDLDHGYLDYKGKYYCVKD